MKNIKNHAQLFIGDQNTVHDYAITYIQKILCIYDGCNICIICQNIIQKTYHNMRWLSSEKYYTKEEISPLFQTLSFTLDHDELFFIIIEKADYLSNACANSLLKILEEPTPGYQFLLLTDRLDQILPTIRSRCTMQVINTHQAPSHVDPFFQLFTTTTPSDPTTFLKMLDKHNPTELKSMHLLNQLLTHWITQYKSNLISTSSQKSSHKKESDNIIRIIALLKKTIQHPPMPGSSKLIWKNLFLQIKLSHLTNN